MAKLVDIYNSEKESLLKRRQLPLNIYDNLTMIMDLNTMGLVCDNPQLKARKYEEFMNKYRILSLEEVKAAIMVDASDIFNVLNQTIPCVGCRRSVERLFSQLCKSGHPALDPLVFTPDGILTIRQDKTHPHSLATLLNGHSDGIECLVLSSSRWKKSQRCALHSLEAGGARGMWGGRAVWRTAWDAMRAPARDHITLVHFNTLHDTLHNYLRKHRFCTDCKTKVLHAYELLIEEKEAQKEKGYVSALYDGINRCFHEKHLHLPAKTDYIVNLITRAEPELLGNHRERHAKTLEIAQEEVLICLGICIYERLQRIKLRLREEEITCQMLTAISVEALYRKFETAVEVKSGVSKLQLLYDEITQEELTIQQRKEQKRLKKRKKKETQADIKCKVTESEDIQDKYCCDSPSNLATQEYMNCYEDREDTCQCQHSTEHHSTGKPGKKQKEKEIKNGNLSPTDLSQDCGYSSGNNNGCYETISGSSSLVSSPEGSEVACSEGFCYHERGDCLDIIKNDKTSCTGFAMSLQDMLMDSCSSDEEHDTSYIPMEVVMEFKSRRNITEKRKELRQNLLQKFAELCVNMPQNNSTTNHIEK